MAHSSAGQTSSSAAGETGLPTTVIGSFPKPEYLKIPDWFGQGQDHTKGYSDLMKELGPQQRSALESDIMRATEEVIRVQRECGVSVVTDGEVRRENYIHYLCRFIGGIDFDKLVTTTYRNGAVTTDLPAVTHEISWRPGSDFTLCADEWRKAQDKAGTDCPVKYTIPGPMTIIGTTNISHGPYAGNEMGLARDLAAKVLNPLIRALVAAGCRVVQVDEPLFARQPQAALEWGIDMLDEVFVGISGERCERQVHMCCGYPTRLDQDDYKKADPNAYHQLAQKIDESPTIDAVSIEDAHCKNDLARLLPQFQKTKVILGVVKIASSKVESVEEINARLREALKFIDKQRLVVAPDCGMAFLTPSILKRKLANMCQAARYAGTDEPCTKCPRR